MNLISPSIADHIVMVIMGIILPLFAISNSNVEIEVEEVEFDTQHKVDMYFSNGLTLWVLTLIICFIWLFSGRPLSEIGFESPQLQGFFWAILTGSILLIYGLDAWNEIRTPEKRAATKEQLLENTPFIPATKLELQHFTILSLTAGFCEEVIFRGYFIQYFLSFTGISPIGQLIAIILPGVIFALSHLYQGWKAVVKIMLFSIALGYIFIETQSIWIVVILHFLIDFIGGYLGMRLMKEPEIS